jgi:hypothetical protein
MVSRELQRRFPRQNSGSSSTREIGKRLRRFLPPIYKEGGGKKPAQNMLLSDVVWEPAVILSSCATLSSESRRRTLVPCRTAGINGFKGAPKEPKGRGRERERTGKRTGRGRRASSGIVGEFAESRSGRWKLCDWAAWPVAMLFWYQRGYQYPPYIFPIAACPFSNAATRSRVCIAEIMART